MILYHRLMFCTGEDNFERVKTLLREKHGLVPPQVADEERLRRQLVWEDETRVGRFRVHFNPGQKNMRFDIPRSGKIRYVEVTGLASQPKIVFTYWSRRLDEATIREDPMKKVYLEVYKLLKPVTVLDGKFVEINLESLLS